MTRKNLLSLFVLLAISIFSLVACGGGEVTISDLPVYPDAAALVPGEDPIADTLVQNMEQNAALQSSMGTGGSLEQKAFSLPAGTTWDDVNNFYTEQLDGWESGMGGVAGDMANDILASANAGNELFQTAMWSNGNQILTVIRQADPTNPEAIYLFLSLNTN